MNSCSYTCLKQRLEVYEYLFIEIAELYFPYYIIFYHPSIAYMKVNLIHSISYTVLFSIIYLQLFCQQKEDSILLAHSEQWKVKLNKGLSGLSRPQFGPY